MKTLILEDDPVATKIMAKYLVQYGTVITASTFKEAYEIYNESAFSSSPFDLICLDLQLPDSNGMEFLREIRASEKENGIAMAFGVKVVVLTGNSDPQAFQSACSKGCDAYLTKPLDRERLKSELIRLELVPPNI